MTSAYLLDTSISYRHNVHKLDCGLRWIRQDKCEVDYLLTDEGDIAMIH